MGRRTSLAASVLAAFLGLFGQAHVAYAAHSAPTGVVADLQGTPIESTEAGQYFCHDFDFPRIHCFSTAERLERALRTATADGDLMAIAAYGSNDFVTVYSEAGYGGAYAHLSQNYDGLWVIGWNDRIRSFKARNSAKGSFHTDWYAGGSRLDFCCNTNTPQLSTTFSGTISSVYRH